MITLEQYMKHYAEYSRAHPMQRAGQAAFNVLHELEPDIANEIRGDNNLDPFYRDSRLVPFTNWLVNRLDMAEYAREVEDPTDVLRD